MGRSERPSILVEVKSLLKWQESARMKDIWGDTDDVHASYYVSHLLQNEPTFTARIGDGEIDIQRLGRGWHNMAYRIGDTVIKIPHSDGPVPGFTYPPTEEGAQLANRHLATLRVVAAQHNLSHLIGEDEAVYFVPGNEEAHIPGEIVSVQKFFDPLIAARDFHTLKASVAERQDLIDEFRNFVDLFWTLRNQHGLHLDNFGFSNLAITHGRDRKLHFVLSDNQPADDETAGTLTRLGLDVMIGKEILMWSIVLGVGSTVRRLVQQRSA